jgi:hypothetical protein
VPRLQCAFGHGRLLGGLLGTRQPLLGRSGNSGNSVVVGALHTAEPALRSEANHDAAAAEMPTRSPPRVGHEWRVDADSAGTNKLTGLHTESIASLSIGAPQCIASSTVHSHTGHGSTSL